MNVGVLTGGGDVPGLNPAIRGVARRCYEHGFRVTGLLDGWRGLTEGDTIDLTHDRVSGILHVGGTILGSSRTNPFKKEADLKKALANVKALGLDAVVAIGGDDTMGVALKLYKEHGFPGVGVPKTMDNDVGETEFCIGFDTSIQVVTEAIDRLHSTASSHHRILVVEVMGRHAGWVALYGGMAGGADYIGIPEQPVDLNEIVAIIRKRNEVKRSFSIIVVAEGAEIMGMKEVEERDNFGHVILAKRAVGQSLAEQIEAGTGIETRAVQLGHLQRGGSPSAMDRILGLRLGVRAADMVKEGKFGYMPALKCAQIVDVPLEQALSRNRTVDMELYQTARVFF
jgi:ATP-dependent phosphofructokinase / diphosphate-dependent phosphofructokinase